MAVKVIEKPEEMQKIALDLFKQGKTVGFVPTMGALHEGHLSLIRKARKDNDVAVVSIFVNPTQFGPNEDYDRYPRTFKEDLKKLEKEGVDFLFYPSNKDMYPEGYETYVELEKLPNHLCGLRRPGHFRGVATVVTKLFNIVFPTTAYFGQKDYQQALIIKKMVRDLNIPVKIEVLPIVREKDGLAMSSRNSYLTPEEREKATVLYRALQEGKRVILSGENDAKKVIIAMKKVFNEVPEAEIDYVAVVDPQTLEDVDFIEGDVLLAVAVFLGNARLIDNELVILEKKD